MKTALKNEDSEFIGVRAIEGVRLLESSRVHSHDLQLGLYAVVLLYYVFLTLTLQT